MVILDHRPVLHLAERGEPAVPTVGVDQCFQGGGGGLLEVQLAGKQLDVLRVDVAHGELQVEVRDLVADLGPLAQADHAHPGCEPGL